VTPKEALIKSVIHCCGEANENFDKISGPIRTPESLNVLIGGADDILDFFTLPILYSCAFARFLLEGGAAITVASTTVPSRMSMQRSAKWPLICSKISWVKA
jgi:hypothetical protein